MGIVPKCGVRAATRAAVVLLAAAAVALAWAPRPAHAANAANVTIVSGIVKSASATELVVNGRTYNIAGVPVRTGRFTPVSPAELAPATKVDLHFHRGKLTLVYVYPNIVE